MGIRCAPPPALQRWVTDPSPLLYRILLAAVAIFSLYSVHLLLKTANEGGALVYEQLGYKAFGMAGKLAASCSITMQNIGGETLPSSAHPCLKPRE